MNDLLKLIKIASKDAIEASKPTAIYFGTVISTSPLKIQLEQKLTLGKAQLILTRNVMDYKTTFTISDEIKEITVHNALKTGEKVVMMRRQGGQKYLIIDRAVNV